MGRSSTTASTRDERGGQLLAKAGEGAVAVVRRVGVRRDEVPDEDLAADRGRLHRGGRGGDAGQGLERGVDLTELDPPAAELDLLVGAADEEQPVGVVDDEVAGAVGALPAEASASARTSRRP